MKKNLTFLGIETSCDETAASIVRENTEGLGDILSNVVSSQVDEHKEFGGVVPELAARAHIEKIDLIINEAIKKSKLNLNDIDGIAATAGPGLIVCLTVGLGTAKAMASSLNKPLIAVNHLEGHALSPKIINKISYPYLLLLISGGHTQFLEVKGVGKYKRLGTTIDDALGEAFDKTAKMLGIEFPGGPKIESYAKMGDENYFKLPKPIINKGGCNLSFAGLKTAVLKISKNINSEKDKFNLAASFQKTVEDILCEKTKVAMKMFRENNNILNSTFVIAGGVASNERIRNKLKNLSLNQNFNPIFPPINLCSDNAAMIAWVGIEKMKLNLINKLDFPAKARWPLDEKAPFLKGAGVKL
ncbi:MAG: tRNA (adenosine(37)-N6)-threonylcarbamoyltransferase complex transferase subunit TsaD [Candidatus Pelagibacterales bacterium]|nr:tRNA (adenosine(37)-N6)-threonylcarbamoyltransferase complex transferase subunit TsaD [Candidatus Pelagibacter sp.]RZO63035.1 MAG: tRNA (adenosine(37)-N6)-threonylcarbamoyltransferase complex transferase subunit TsaD [Pelagibacterales bacterium]|tara:strand:+ start:2251 stop:3324 length:1074 start_codon:yes stop_codon:yes gene_type:complete